MTDDVCDSWEDVDVDKIVIKTSSKINTNDKKPTYSSILASNTNINSKIIIHTNNFDDGDDCPEHQTSNGIIPFRVLPRASIDSNNTNNGDDCSPFINQPKIILEDNNRTQFIKGLRILNRPNKNNEDKNQTKLKADEIQLKLKKSLEERQAQYAKARLRIMGECMPAEDLITNMTNAMDTVNLDQQKQVPSEASNQNNKNNVANNDFVKTIADNVDTSQQFIIRQPTAPDGTRGFGANRN